MTVHRRAQTLIQTHGCTDMHKHSFSYSKCICCQLELAGWWCKGHHLNYFFHCFKGRRQSESLRVALPKATNSWDIYFDFGLEILNGFHCLTHIVSCCCHALWSTTQLNAWVYGSGDIIHPIKGWNHKKRKKSQNGCHIWVESKDAIVSVCEKDAGLVNREFSKANCEHRPGFSVCNLWWTCGKNESNLYLWQTGAAATLSSALCVWILDKQRAWI